MTTKTDTTPLPCPFCGCAMSLSAVARDWWRVTGDHSDDCILLGQRADAPQTDDQKQLLIGAWNRRAAVEADRKRRGEPVAWRTYDRNGWYVFSTTREEAERDFPGKDHQPLYTAPVAAQAQHPDDAAVEAFAAAMKAKLAQARAKGRHGWHECAPADLSAMLRAHVEKGDPRDVANFCMFLWSLGHPISAAPVAQEPECSHCGGTGDVSGEYPGTTCPACGGTGKEVLVADRAAKEPRPPEFNTGDPLLDVLLTNTHYHSATGDMDNALLWIESLGTYLAHTKSVAQPAVGEEIHIHIEGQDVLTLPLASSGMDAPRFVVHVPAQAQSSGNPGELDAHDRADAERYRWLREHGFNHADVELTSDLDGNPITIWRLRFYIPEPSGLPYEEDEWTLEQLDAAIDHARAEKGEA